MRPLTESQQSLASDPKHIRMAERFAEFACEKRGLPFLIPDAKAAALLGLVKAARDFDPDRGLLFKTFADHRIRGEVLDFFRSEEIAGYRRRRGRSQDKRAPKLRSLDGIRDSVAARSIFDAARPELPQEADPDSGEFIEIAEWRDELEALAKRSGGRRQAEVIRLLYGGARVGECHTRKLAGKVLGLSEGRVSQLHSEAVANLKRYFKEKEAKKEDGR